MGVVQGGVGGNYKPGTVTPTPPSEPTARVEGDRVEVVVVVGWVAEGVVVVVGGTSMHKE